MKDNLLSNKNLNKLLLFFENKSIKAVTASYVISFLIIYLMKRLAKMEYLYGLLVNDFGKYLTENNSNYITIATVFVGIYFTIYTLLMTVNKGASYDRLDKNNKLTLLRILNSGFGSSFFYVLVSLFYVEFYSLNKCLASFLMIGLMIRFLYSAFVFAIVIFFMIKSDIESTLDNSEF